MDVDRRFLALEALWWQTTGGSDAPAEIIDSYIRSLGSIDADVLAEACARIASQVERFPPVANIVALCREVEQEALAPQLDAEKTARWQSPTIPEARAKLWVAHLKRVIMAKRMGHRPPPAPEPFDVADPRTFYHCANCQDSGWILHRCEGGDRRTCGREDSNRWQDGALFAACRTRHNFAICCRH